MRHHLQTRFPGISSGMISRQKPYDSLLGITDPFGNRGLHSAPGPQYLVFSSQMGNRSEAGAPLTLPPLGFAFLQASLPLLLRVEEKKGPRHSRCPPHHGAGLPARMGKISSSFSLASHGHRHPCPLSPLPLAGVTSGSIL